MLFCPVNTGAATASLRSRFHELGREVPSTVEEEQRHGVRAESGFVDGFARSVPIDAREQAPRPDEVIIQSAHDIQA